MTTWIAKYVDTIIDSGYYTLLFDGLKTTVIITLGALVIGVVIGTLIALVKYFAEEAVWLKPLAHVCDWYVTVIRGMPVVVLLLVFYYIFMTSSEGIPVGIVTFGINSGAYMAELIRSGIGAVDVGQMEAARSLGMSRGRAMRIVIMPQAIRYIFPAIGNEFIALLKETAVAGYVAVTDLTRAANLIRNNTFDAVNPLLTISVGYVLLVVILTQILGALERRMGNGDQR